MESNKLKLSHQNKNIVIIRDMKKLIFRNFLITNLLFLVLSNKAPIKILVNLELMGIIPFPEYLFKYLELFMSVKLINS